MKCFLRVIILWVLISIPQEYCRAQLTARLQLMNIQSVSLSDLDLTKPQNAPILFFVYIDNDSKHPLVNVSILLSSTSRGLIGKLSLSNFSLPPNTRTTITNRNFTSVDLNINPPVGQQFLNAVKATGTFPPDDYQYLLKIDSAGYTLSTDQSSSTVNNPNYNPELILPGTSFNQSMQKIYTPQPLFQWFGQTSKFDLVLYEVLPGQITPEDIARNTPVFKQTGLSGNQFLYPASAEKLVNGKIYAWQIFGELQAAKGTQLLPSEMYRFTFVDPAGGATSSSHGGITPRTVSKIIISPQDISINAGQQTQFFATYYDQDNNQILNDIHPQWQLSPTDKGTLTSQGLFTAGNYPATVAVIVKAGIANEFATVTINPNPSAGTSSVNLEQWEISNMLMQLFGVNNH